MLKSAAANLPHDREIVLYCGCCPWDRCPNVKPAIEALKQMGFTKVKVLYLETNFTSELDRQRLSGGRWSAPAMVAQYLSSALAFPPIGLSTRGARGLAFSPARRGFC